MNDSFHTQPTANPNPDDAALLYGDDPTPGVVAVDLASGDRMHVYRRVGKETVRETERFVPWIVAARGDPWRSLASVASIEPLEGPHPLRFLVTFRDWSGAQDAARAARESGERFFRMRSPVEQYLTLTGRTLFKGLAFGDLRRMQLDIETATLDPDHRDAALLMVSLTDTSGHAEVLVRESDDAELLDRLERRVAALDPDVIEGHNIFNFDLPYLRARAIAIGRELHWGRDGSSVHFPERPSRFKAGQLTLPYSPAHVHGRHVIDTYQQIQRFDVGGRLRSYGLKPAMRELGLERPGRTHVPGEAIAELWQTDPARLASYALDDARDVEELSRLTTQTEFYQSQVLPRGYQAVATGGPGEKINDLMVRAYLARRHSLPDAQSPRDYPGGHAEILETGVFRPVVKCDVESLYPSIMLADRITSKSDTLGFYLPMLADLTHRRIEAKARGRREREHGNVEAAAMWDGIQGSFKVLINSFYGYLGYRGGLFNDFEAAGRVTLTGQAIVQRIVATLRAAGAQPIEVDTDGVYFVPPDGIDDHGSETAFIERISATLPAGIRLAHDGRYAGMLSLRVKTYALLEADGRLILKGSSLRSRRMERCFREFLETAARHFLQGDSGAARDAYFALARRIRQRTVPLADIVQWQLVNEETLDSQPRLRDLGRRSGGAVRSGERAEYYEREDGALALREEYAGDESVVHLLRRLHDVAGRFRELHPDQIAFDATFPAITMRTDLAAAQTAVPATQLTMF